MSATQEEEILDREMIAAQNMKLHYGIVDKVTELYSAPGIHRWAVIRTPIPLGVEPRTKEKRALLPALIHAGYTTTLESFHSRAKAREFAAWLYSRRYGIEAQAALEFVKYLQDIDREED